MVTWGWMSSFIQYDIQFDNIREEQHFKDIIAKALERQEEVQKQIRELLPMEELLDW